MGKSEEREGEWASEMGSDRQHGGPPKVCGSHSRATPTRGVSGLQPRPAAWTQMGWRMRSSWGSLQVQAPAGYPKAPAVLKALS